MLVGSSVDISLDCLRGDAVTSGIDMTLLMLLMGLIRIVFLQHRLV